jgi:hypothetical protein
MAAYVTILLLIALGRLFAAGRVLPDNAAATLNQVAATKCLHRVSLPWRRPVALLLLPARQSLRIARTTTRGILADRSQAATLVQSFLGSLFDTGRLMS